MLKEKWSALKARCKTCSRVTLVLAVGFGALLVAGGLLAAGAAGLAWTNTESFCVSCHEMRDNVYAEFDGTIHASNRSGVRAICSDCHVPREPGPLLMAKILATKDLYHHLLGTIDTKEKFEAKRHELATNVWRKMKQTDSLPCRNCHVESAMSADLQSERAQSQHAKAKAEKLTCIDCHYGIAHTEPEGPGPQELDMSK